MFMYKVVDESMMNERICAGDLVRIKLTNDVSSHEIAAIACDDDISRLTFRRIERWCECIYRLHPSSPYMRSEMKSNVMIVGKVVRLEVGT